MAKQKRINKSKKEVVSDIQLVQDATRRRSLVRDIVFPYLMKINENIGYSKVFIQAFNALVSGTYEQQAKKTTIGMIMPEIENKLLDIFKLSDPEQKREYERYKGLLDLIKDVSVQDLEYATQLPRYIDGYLLQDKNKENISVVDVEKILG